MKNRALIGLFVLAVFWVNASQGQEFVTKDLIGFWSLDKDTIKDKTVQDVFGTNHGTISGDPKITQGKIGDALEFDGKDDYVQLPDMGNEPAVTVEAWTLAHSMPPQAHSCCIGIVSSAPDDQWKAGTVHFKFEAGQITVHKNDSDKVRFDGAVVDKWYHAVYTSDTKENKLKLYVNGDFIGEFTTGATPNNLTHIRIASEHEGRYLPGLVDEVRIYKRALSEDEIKKNFMATSNKTTVVASGKLTVTWGMIKSD